jgi:hypothetical protein
LRRLNLDGRDKPGHEAFKICRAPLGQLQKPQRKTFSLNLADPNPSWEYTSATERLDRPTARFTGPIGVDGLFRKSSARYGIDAVKGSWLDDRTFVVERRILGRAETQRWTLAFEGKTVNVKFESTDGAKVELHGEADE